MPQVTLDSVAVREIFPGLRARIIHTERTSHSWVQIDPDASFPSISIHTNKWSTCSKARSNLSSMVKPMC